MVAQRRPPERRYPSAVPRYEYRCPTCEDRFEVVRSMTDAAGPVACPSGHEGARRVFSAVASVGRAGP